MKIEKIEMVNSHRKKRKVYNTWTMYEKRILVEKRIEKENLFNRKSVKVAQSWRDLMEELEPLLGKGKTAEGCKGQWRSIEKKYKSLFTHTSENGTEEENINEDARDWELFDIFHNYAKTNNKYLISNIPGFPIFPLANLESTPSPHRPCIRPRATHFITQ